MPAQYRQIAHVCSFDWRYDVMVLGLLRRLAIGSAPAATTRSTPDEIWSAMQTEKMEGFPLSDIIGGGDPKKISVDLVALMRKYVQLDPEATILDVGCGCGRIATGFIDYLKANSKYVGIDIIPGLIEFASRRLSKNYPNFQFYCRDQTNTTYDHLIKGREINKIHSVAEVCANGTIDFALATSLFTHLDFPEASTILKEVVLALKPQGRAFLTFFVLDPEALASTTGWSIFTFQHKSKSERAYIDRKEEPNFAVGYTEKQLGELLAESGLVLEKRIAGSWCGLAGRETYQDSIIARKMP